MSLAQGHAQLFSNVPFINHGRVSDGAGVVYVQGAGLQDCRIAGGAAGSGGSGVVILSLPTAKYSGTTTGSPTVTTSGSNTIITFTASGTYTA